MFLSPVTFGVAVTKVYMYITQCLFYYRHKENGKQGPQTHETHERHTGEHCLVTTIYR